MCHYSQKLVFLVLRCLLFGLIGGAVFAVIFDSDLGLLPYIAAMGGGAGWSLTRPLGVIALGKNGVICTAFFFAVRVGVALIVGWTILIPYVVYLVVQIIRIRS